MNIRKQIRGDGETEMTIQEAIKSGRKYKRKYWDFWHDAKSPFVYNMEDILADDWEIEREPEEVWLVKHQAGDFYSGVYGSECSARNSTAASNCCATVIKFREVIE